MNCSVMTSRKSMASRDSKMASFSSRRYPRPEPSIGTATTRSTALDIALTCMHSQGFVLDGRAVRPRPNQIVVGTIEAEDERRQQSGDRGDDAVAQVRRAERRLRPRDDVGDVARAVAEIEDDLRRRVDPQHQDAGRTSGRAEHYRVAAI